MALLPVFRWCRDSIVMLVFTFPEFGSQLVLKPGNNKNTYFAVTYKYRRGKLPANARQISVQYVLAGGGNRDDIHLKKLKITREVSPRNQRE